MKRFDIAPLSRFESGNSVASPRFTRSAAAATRRTCTAIATLKATNSTTSSAAVAAGPRFRDTNFFS